MPLSNSVPELWTTTCFKFASSNTKADGKPSGQILLLSENDSSSDIRKKLESMQINDWQIDDTLTRSEEFILVSTDKGPLWLVKPKGFAPNLKPSPVLNAFNPYSQGYSKMRDLGGTIIQEFSAITLKELTIHRFSSVTDEQALGFIVGLNLGAYRYLESRRPKPTGLMLEGFSQQTIDQAEAIAKSTNIARHLVNVPPSELNPQALSDYVLETFKNIPEMNVETLVGDQLTKEGLGLLHAVGKAADSEPRLIVLRYKPRATKNTKKVAFVGKGITFDTGGLDLKPADGMRFMKKDMGGAAALIGFAHYLVTAKADFPCDIYLAIAENAISQKAFKPSDVVKSFSGTTVEIHNTDAEGRLVLCDAMSKALKDIARKDLHCLIDVATLTGAIKMALGTKLAGLFCNHDDLSRAIVHAGNTWADPCWRMPLFDGYKTELRSVTADMTNASNSRFGGAITAALYLQHFVKDIPWAHLDIYSWVDSSAGAFREDGGSGQGVGTLIGLTQSTEFWTSLA